MVVPPAYINFLFTQAVEHHRAGRVTQARDAYLEVLRHVPDHADALHLLGRLFLDHGFLKEAVTLIERALQTEPGLRAAHTSLGDAYRRMGRMTEAVEQYQAAIEGSEPPEDALANLGVTWIALRRPDEAEKAFRRCLQVEPDIPEAHAGLGDALVMAGRVEEGCAAYRRAVELEPEDSRFRLRLGDALEKLGQAKAATDQYVVAFEQVSDTAEVYARLALIVADRLATDHGDNDAHDRAEYLSVLPVPKGWQTADARAILDAGLGRGDGRVFSVRLLESTDAPMRRVEAPLAGQVFELERATVCNDLWYILAGNKLLHPDLHAHMSGNRELPAARLHAGDRAVVDPDRPRARVDGAAVLIGGCCNYYHWLVDHLPLLAVVAGCPDLADLPLIVNADRAPYQAESLAALGIGADRLLGFDDADYIDVDRLHVPLIPDRRGVPWGASDWWWRSTLTASVHAWLRETFTAGMKTNAGRRLFVSRIDAGFRRAVNEAEIQDIARAEGYEIVDARDLSFIDQVRNFAGASHVAGVHGAGLVNAVFTPPGARVIEFVGDGVAPDFYRHLADVGGLSFQRVSCAVTGNVSEEHPNDRRYNDIRIDPEAARAALAS